MNLLFLGSVVPRLAVFCILSPKLTVFRSVLWRLIPVGCWHRDLWEMVVPANCAAAMPEAPWACGLANFSIPFASSDIFVVEMLIDSVQQSLHSG